MAQEKKENQEKEATKEKTLGFQEKIVKAFETEKLADNAKYFSKSKEEISKDFLVFIKTKYPDGTLKELQKGGDITFNSTITDKGFKISDLITDHKKNQMESILKTTNSETTAINTALMNCYQQWKNLDPAIQAVVDFSAFLGQIGISGNPNASGEFTKFTLLPNASAGKSLGGINIARNSFIEGKSLSDTQKELYQGFLKTEHFDPKEKLSCVASADLLRKKCEELDGDEGAAALALRDQSFGVENINGQIHAETSWLTISGLQITLESFFRRLSSIGLDEGDFLKIKNTRVTANDLIESGKNRGELLSNNYLKGFESKRFSDMSNELKSISNAMFDADTISNLDAILEDIEQTESDYMSAFALPGNMLDFFKQFGTPDKIHPASNNPAYQAKSKEIEEVRRKLSKAKNYSAEQQALQLEYDKLRTERNAIAAAYTTTTREQYFGYIGNKIDDACDAISVSSYGSTISKVLQKLQTNQWNITTLSKSEQSMLMKASVDLKLQSMQSSKILASLGQDFDLYRQFVSNLYDIESKESVLRMKNGETLTIHFSDKKFVGKPQEFASVQTNNLDDLKNIRVEFEIDLDKSSPSSEVEMMLKAITGGNQSNIMRNFFGNVAGTNFPKVISDSNKVRMIHKNGQVYEGYLSPTTQVTDLYDIPGEEGNGRIGANTFLLYSHPADKLVEARTIKTMVDPDNPGKILRDTNKKMMPVHINGNNLHDRSSIEIIDNKVTLSNSAINALTLAHKVVEQLDNRPQDQKDIEDTLNELDPKIKDLQNSIKKNDAIDRVKKNDTENSKTNYFQTSWNKLFPKNNEEKIECKEGLRFATPLNAVKDGLIEITIKKVYKDENDIITSCDFSFKNLSYSGTIAVPDRNLNDIGIQRLVEIISSNSSFELPNKKGSYSETVAAVKGAKPANSYNFSLFEGLGFDEKSGYFHKGGKKDPVTVFVDDSKKPRIEYSISKKGENYEIVSTGYESEEISKDENGKIKKEKVVKNFATTTSLEGMLLILAAKKGLVPLTSQEKSNFDAENPGDNVLPAKPQKRRSFSNIRSVLKGDGKKLLDTFKKKRGEEKDKELRYRMFVEGGIYRKLDGLFGGLLEKFDLNAFDDLADEAEAGAMDYGREKIKGYFDHLEKFHHSYNYGVQAIKVDDKDKGGTGSSKMVHEYMEIALNKYASGSITYKDRLKVAGSLMHMLKTFKTGYAKEMKDYPKGTYVKILFGGKAQAVFLAKYEAKKRELENSKQGNQIQELLSMMEYNFIVENIRGGGAQDNRVKNLDSLELKDQRYYQRLYGRSFGKELGKIVGETKSISADKDNEKIKGMIASGNYQHVKNDLYDHLGANRVEEAVGEIVALQQMATTADQAKEVMIALMTGILNGMFVHNLSATTKEQLKIVARNSGFVFSSRLEHFDAPQKIAGLLMTASGGSFNNFRYKSGSYNPADFDPIQDPSKRDLGSFAKEFPKRFNDFEKNNNNQISDFIYMKNLNADDDNNLMHVWKSKDPPEIYNRIITQTEKDNITSIMKEFRFNKDRGAKIENYNYAAGFENTRTMIESAQKQWNKLDGGWYAPGVGDHAETYRGAIGNGLPPHNQQLKANQKYKLGAYVDEFFRTFQGIGSVKYNPDEIAKFYKYIRLAKQQLQNGKRAEASRLLWFYLTSEVYAGGPVPDEIESALAQSAQFFETNLSLFDEEVGQLHPQPGSGDSKDFGYIWDGNKHMDLVYEERRNRDTLPDERIKSESNNRMINSQQKMIVNFEMDQKNKKAMGLRTPGGNSNADNIGVSIDQKISELKGSRGYPNYNNGEIQATHIADSSNLDDVAIPSASSDTIVGRSAKSIIDEVKAKYNKQSTNNGATNTLTDEELSTLEEAGLR